MPIVLCYLAYIKKFNYRDKGEYLGPVYMVSGETTLPPSYPGRANFSLISLKNSTNCLHQNANSSWGVGGGGGRDNSGGLGRARQVG